MNLRILTSRGGDGAVRTIWWAILLTLLSAVPALAQSDCTPFALEQLSKLDQRQISGQIPEIAQLQPDQIKEVQRCLKSRGCYARDPAAIDGIVKNFTGAALTRSATGRCAVRPLAAESCRVGNDAISWQLTAANIKLLQTPEKQDAPPSDPSSPAEAAPPPPPMSDALKAGLQLMQNADYFSMDLFENDLRYFTLEPIADEKVKKAATIELDGMLPKIRENACKSHSFDTTPPAPDPDLGVNQTEALSDGVYGFFPFWGFPQTVEEEQGKPDSKGDKKAGSELTRHKVDLGTVGRIAWFGATFNNSGQLDLPSLKSPKVHSIVMEEIAIARRYRTDVDLVVYKKLSEAQWSQLISADPDTFIDNLSGGIAKEVGNFLGGFLDSVQCWAIPSALTSSPLEWDGATLYLDGFPWGDPTAMDFLKKLLRRLRIALYDRQESSAICSRARPQLNLNLVVPFDALVLDPPQPPGQQTPRQPALNPTIAALSQLIPNKRSDINLASRRPPDVDVVDAFVVFLPQSSSVNKKRLRQSIEAAFNRNEDTLRAVEENVDVDLAVWRYQMLRRIIYILSPEMAKYKGDYAKPGLQLLDDMVYAKNNFAVLGFMPLPVHDRNNPTLASDIRVVFRRERRDWVERNISPVVEKILGTPVVNIICSRRREIFLLIEAIASLLFAYFVVSRWIFELRDFFVTHKIPFIALFLFGAAATALLCLFDRNLKQLASYLLAGLLVVSAAIFGLWKYRQSKVEADLP